VLCAVRWRLVAGLALAAVASGAAFAVTDRPWFWFWCALHVVPAAFDLKNLLDAAGRTRGEVALESLAAVLQVGLVAVWAAAGGERLETVAAISLACRIVYAAGAAIAIRRLPASATGAAPLSFRLSAVGVGQAVHELLATGDIALVAMAGGDVAAGYYAVAARFAAAALLPSAQLARLLLPHLLHAPDRGDARRTLATAQRATLWLTLPMVAGGFVVAESLCALSGSAFLASGPTLRVLLVAGLLQHVGWQFSHTLLAGGRDRAYAHGLAWPSLLHALLLVLIPVASTAEPTALALLAGAAALAAQLAYGLAGAGLVRAGAPPLRQLAGPAAAAVATAAAAWLPTPWLAQPLQLPVQLALGGAAFAAVLWRFELKGRVGRVGDGLATASGFVE
jgi:O-antigen/teichoic acid export membrane protein